MRIKSGLHNGRISEDTHHYVEESIPLSVAEALFGVACGLIVGGVLYALSVWVRRVF